MNTAFGIIAFMTGVVCRFACGGIVDKNEDLADRRAGLCLQFLDEGVEIVHVLRALGRIVDQRTQQPR